MLLGKQKSSSLFTLRLQNNTTTVTLLCIDVTPSHRVTLHMSGVIQQIKKKTHNHPLQRHGSLYVNKEAPAVQSREVENISLTGDVFPPTASFPVPSEPVAASAVLCGRAHGRD